MRSIGAYEAKTHFSRLLDEVAKGETITITKHGIPVARIMPAVADQQLTPVEAYEQWERYRKEHNIRLDGLSIREMIEEGRM